MFAIDVGPLAPFLLAMDCKLAEVTFSFCLSLIIAEQAKRKADRRARGEVAMVALANAHLSPSTQPKILVRPRTKLWARTHSLVIKLGFSAYRFETSTPTWIRYLPSVKPPAS